MPAAARQSAQVHSMVQGRHEWYCTAKNPRCGFTTKDPAEMLAHVTAQQQDLRHLKPLPGIVGVTDGEGEAA